MFAIPAAKTTFFASREEYLAYRAEWKAMAHSKSLTAEDMARHHLLMGKDLYRAFSPSKRSARNGHGTHAILAGIIERFSLRGRYLKDEQALATPSGRLNRLLTSSQLDFESIRAGNASFQQGA